MRLQYGTDDVTPMSTDERIESSSSLTLHVIGVMVMTLMLTHMTRTFSKPVLAMTAIPSEEEDNRMVIDKAAAETP